MRRVALPRSDGGGPKKAVVISYVPLLTGEPGRVLAAFKVLNAATVGATLCMSLPAGQFWWSHSLERQQERKQIGHFLLAELAFQALRHDRDPTGFNLLDAGSWNPDFGTVCRDQVDGPGGVPAHHAVVHPAFPGRDDDGF